ncbi:MAG: response regulator [Planctomycetes bacterium]|nr:response regulator [Planctomycetota bacterium]
MKKNKPTVLVCDDLDILRQMMRGLLEAAGCSVQEASDGETCLKMAERFRPDLMILDVMMPGMHGVDVMKHLLPQPGFRTKIVVCTAKDHPQEMELFRSLGAVDVIIKPIVAETFVSRIMALLEGPSGPAEAQPASSAAPLPPYQPLASSSDLEMRFWGTRGSIPVSGAGTARFGGNTSCFSLESGSELLVIDAGSGIRELGLRLMAGPPRHVHLFITHTHWDHIQGFPFFLPAYVPGWKISIYGASGFGKDLEAIFRGQLDQDYFPVRLEDMRAQIDFRILESGPQQAGSFELSWDYVQHPGVAVGYRIRHGKLEIGYASDNEYLKGYLGDPATVPDEVSVLSEGVVRLFKSVDILIHEAQYTHNEYRGRIGWGHSSIANACSLATLCEAKRWIVTHHDPMHDDNFIQDHFHQIRRELSRLGGKATVEMAHDGMSDWL